MGRNYSALRTSMIRSFIRSTLLVLTLSVSVFAQTVFLGNGSAANPSLRYNSDPNTGQYLFGPDSIGWTTGGAHSLGLRGGASPTLFGGAGNFTLQCGTGNSRSCFFNTTNGGGTAQGNLSLLGGVNPTNSIGMAGTAANPSLVWLGDNTGLYLKGTDTVSVSTNGSATIHYAVGPVWIGGGNSLTVRSGIGNSIPITFQTTTSAGTAKNTLVLGADSSATFLGSLKSAQTFLRVDNPVRAATGSTNSLPAFALAQSGADTATGMAMGGGAGTLTLTVQTNQVARGTTSSFRATQQFFAQGPAASTNCTTTPLVALNTDALDNNTGICRKGEDTVGVVAGGTAPLYVKTDTVILLNKAKAPALTAASGTPNTMCIDATSKQITENAATSCVVSSRRFKENIRQLSAKEAYAIGLNLRPSTFTYKNGGRRAFGLIAEQADSVDQRLTTRNSDGQLNSVNYEQVTIILLKMVQEQDRRIAALESELQKLKAKK